MSNAKLHYIRGGEKILAINTDHTFAVLMDGPVLTIERLDGTAFTFIATSEQEAERAVLVMSHPWSNPTGSDY